MRERTRCTLLDPREDARVLDVDVDADADEDATRESDDPRLDRPVMTRRPTVIVTRQGGVGRGREVGAWSLQQTPPARVEINQAKNRV